jgi:hypothetical protein
MRISQQSSRFQNPGKTLHEVNSTKKDMRQPKIFQFTILCSSENDVFEKFGARFFMKIDGNGKFSIFNMFSRERIKSIGEFSQSSFSSLFTQLLVLVGHAL